MSRSSESPLLEVFDQNTLLWILVVLLLKFAHCIWNTQQCMALWAGATCRRPIC